MKTLAMLVLFAGLMIGPTPLVGEHCVGANHAALEAIAAQYLPHGIPFEVAAQERSTPPGEWCQRPQRNMPAKAHACECHKHDCTKDPDDQNNLSAHTDAKCLNFCTTANCQCSVMDCK